MFNLSDVSNQYFFVATRTCNLKCHYCPLLENNKCLTEDITTLIKEGNFFSYFPFVATYNVVGGDPLMFVDLVYLLTF